MRESFFFVFAFLHLLSFFSPLLLSSPSSFPLFLFLSSLLTSERVQHDERGVPQPHQRLGHLDADFLERVEGVAKDLGAAPAEEQGDEVELEVQRAGLQQGDGSSGAGDWGQVDDAPEGPDAGEDLDDCFFLWVCECVRGGGGEFWSLGRGDEFLCV